MGRVSYKDRAVFKCEMCKESSWGVANRFLWIGWLTKEEIDICQKCAQREVGKKSWPKLKESVNEKNKQ